MSPSLLKPTPDPFPDRLTDNVRRLLARVQAGPERDRWPGGEGAPDLIVLLLRAAVIPFAAVRGCAETHDISLPPVVEAHIGSELYRCYKEARGMTPGLTFMSLDREQIADYHAWLDQDGYVQEVVARLQRDAAAAGVERPGRIMIYDDFECEHGTMDAARYLVGRTFPGAEIEASIPMVQSSDIIIPLLADLPLPEEEAQHARFFLFEVAKGSRETPSGLVALDSREELRSLNRQARHWSRDIYDRLAAIYGEQELLALPDRVQEAMRAWGRQIDPALPSPARNVILLTSPGGIDKKAIIQETLAWLPTPEEGKPGAGGFTMVPNETGDGYELVSLDGHRVPVATTGEADFSDPVTVSRPDGTYTVDRAAVTEMVRRTLALAMLGQAVVIGEIGPLLLTSDAFCGRIWWLLEYGSAPVLGTITSHPHPFFDRIRTHRAVELIEVKEENQDTLPEVLAGRLAEQVRGLDPLAGLVVREETA